MTNCNLLEKCQYELERCGLPNNPVDIIGRKFSLEINRALPQDHPPVERGYLLYGTIIGVEYIDEEKTICLVITPRETALGTIISLWPNDDGVHVCWGEADGYFKGRDPDGNDINGKLKLL